MEFTKDTGDATYRIEGYYFPDDGGKPYITINSQKYYQTLLIMPELLLTPWGPDSIHQLEQTHFEALLKLEYPPQVVLLGTGSTLHFPNPDLYHILIYHNIGVEVMNTAAACRTYQILMSEGRQVAAILIV